MKNYEFWILNGLSGLVVVLLTTHVFVMRAASSQQQQLVLAQQFVNQGQQAQSFVQQLAVRINTESQKGGGNQALKDLLTREQIKVNNGDSSGVASTPSPTSTGH